MNAEDKGKKRAPSKSKSQYGDIFHLYETQSDWIPSEGNSAPEHGKEPKTASNTSKIIHSSSVHPSTEEGMLKLLLKIFRMTRDFTSMCSTINYSSSKNMFSRIRKENLVN